MLTSTCRPAAPVVVPLMASTPPSSALLMTPSPAMGMSMWMPGGAVSTTRWLSALALLPASSLTMAVSVCSPLESAPLMAGVTASFQLSPLTVAW
jgi:hypothetical protein